MAKVWAVWRKKIGKKIGDSFLFFNTETSIDHSDSFINPRAWGHHVPS
jgi:hypothetical protein